MNQQLAFRIQRKGLVATESHGVEILMTDVLSGPAVTARHSPPLDYCNRLPLVTTSDCKLPTNRNNTHCFAQRSSPVKISLPPHVGSPSRIMAKNSETQAIERLHARQLTLVCVGLHRCKDLFTRILRAIRSRNDICLLQDLHHALHGGSLLLHHLPHSVGLC